MTPGTFLTVLVVGLLAGWLEALGLSPDQGTFATIAVALVGAASLIGAQRQFWHGAPPRKSRPGRRRS